MKRETVLLVAVLAWGAAPVASAGESGVNSPPAGRGEERGNSAAVEYKLDFKELFGCEPMEGNGHVHRPAAETNEQGTVPPAQGQERMQEKR